MNARSRTWPGRRRSSSSTSFMIPLSKATSPLIRTGRNSSAIAVPPVEQVADVLRVGEAVEAALAQRVDADDVAARCAPRPSSAESIRGWFVPGFWPITKIASASAKSSSETVPLPTPIDLPKADAARLVAHVRAVGQVVRAELADEELVEERGLVAGPARGVEDRLVGRIERLAARRRSGRRRRPRRSARNGPRPRRGPSVGSAAPGLRASSRTVRAGSDTDHSRKKSGVTRRVVASAASRLGPVLAELGMRAMLDVRLGPGAAGAVESVGLVHLQESRGASQHAHLMDDMLDRARDGAKAGRGVRVGTHVDARASRRAERIGSGFVGLSTVVDGLANRTRHVAPPLGIVNGRGRSVPGAYRC